MNKYVVFLLLTGCFFTACKHKNYLNVVKNDWRKNNLKGRVKKIVSVRYFDSGTDQQIDEYNEKGFLISVVYGVLGKKKGDSTSYQYDEVWNTTTITNITTEGEKKKDYYKYDGNGNLVEEKNNVVRKTYSYDDSNRVVEEKVYVNGSLYDKSSSEYKSDGSMVSVTTDGRTGRKTTETSKNDSVEYRRHFDDNGAVKNTWLFRNDKADNLVYGKEEEKGNIRYTNFYYNDFNDKVMEVTFDSEKKAFDTLTYTYTYDKIGNWIEKKGKCNRKITYW